MEKIDHRIKYYLIVDTETANTFKDGNNLDTSSALVYDIGFAVIDKRGKIYEKKSMVIPDVFFDMPEIMETAYYKEKVPLYYEAIHNYETEIRTFFKARKIIHEIMLRYNINIVVAHNARFDVCVLNTTTRYLSKSLCRYFFPKDTIFYDSLKMARSVILKMPTYRLFCENREMLTKNGRLSATAENLFRYISKIDDFEEKHTALADVEIEAQIFAYCFKQHKPMNKLLWE